MFDVCPTLYKQCVIYCQISSKENFDKKSVHLVYSQLD